MTAIEAHEKYGGILSEWIDAFLKSHNGKDMQGVCVPSGVAMRDFMDALGIGYAESFDEPPAAHHGGTISGDDMDRMISGDDMVLVRVSHD